MKWIYSLIALLYGGAFLFGQTLTPKEIIKKSEEKLRGGVRFHLS